MVLPFMACLISTGRPDPVDGDLSPFRLARIHSARLKEALALEPWVVLLEPVRDLVGREQRSRALWWVQGIGRSL